MSEQGRQRAPKGYKDEVVLTLTQIKEGSTLLTLAAPPRTSAEQLQSGSSLASAIDDLLSFLKDGSLPPGSNHQVMARCVKSLGASLQDDEEVTFAANQKESRYSQSVRRILLQSLKKPFSRKEDRVFAVSGHNKRAQSFELCTPQDQVVKLTYPEDEESRTALEVAFEGWLSIAKNRKVLVSGDFSYSPEGRLVTIEPTSVEALEDRDLRWRIPFLRQRVIEQTDRDALDRFEKEWNKVQGLWSEHPYLYILEPGVLSAEWDLPDGELSMTVDGTRLSLLHLGSQEEEVELTAFEQAFEWLTFRAA